MFKKINKKLKISLLIIAVGFFMASLVFASWNFKKSEGPSSVELTLNSTSPNGLGGGVMIPASCESGYTGHECCPSCGDTSRYCVGVVYSDGCGWNTCSGTKTPDCSKANEYNVGVTFSDGCGGTCIGTATPSICTPLACDNVGTFCIGSGYADGCGGFCWGTKSDCPAC